MSNERTDRSETSAFSRRTFLKQAATVSAAAAAAAMPLSRVRGANERPGVAVIGTGGRGNGHLQALKWLRDKGEIDIVAVCDTYRPRMTRTADEYGVKGYMDHRELLADPKVDVVTIATPDHIHGYQAIDAINAGKDVYCEKPVTHWRQFELTKKLAETVKASDRVFLLGTQGMSDGAWHQMRQLVADGLIGQPLLAECGYFRVGDWGERGMPIDDPNAKPGPDLNWEAFLGDSPKRDFDVSRYFRWRMYEDYAGGPVTDLFPHSLTPTLYILGLGMPSSVVATAGMLRYTEREVPDTCNLFIDYPEKVTVAVLGTQGNDYSATGSRGAGGRVPVIRGWDGTITVQDKEIVFIPADGSEKKAQRFAIEHGEDMIAHFKNLIDAVKSRNKETFSTMELAFKVQTPLQMAALSAREGKAIKFDAEKQSIVL